MTMRQQYGQDRTVYVLFHFVISIPYSLGVIISTISDFVPRKLALVNEQNLIELKLEKFTWTVVSWEQFLTLLQLLTKFIHQKVSKT